MKSMILIVVLSVLSLGGGVLAADQTFTGAISDKMCGAKHSDDRADFPSRRRTLHRSWITSQMQSRCAERATTQRPHLHEVENDRRDDEDVNGRGDHSADDRRRDRLHDVGPDAGAPQNR